jgi:hypothetical protein
MARLPSVRPAVSVRIGATVDLLDIPGALNARQTEKFLRDNGGSSTLQPLSRLSLEAAFRCAYPNEELVGYDAPEPDGPVVHEAKVHWIVAPSKVPSHQLPSDGW